MSLHHTLSRLLSGDLSETEEADIRRRIAEEPEVAAAWASMQQTVSRLAALPDVPPPAHLNAQLARPRPRWLVAVGGLAVPALALLVLRAVQPAPPTIVLVEGRQWVDGQAVVMAADQQIAIDGRAEVSVEPLPGAVREPGRTPQEVPMNTSSIIAAAAGSLVTVAVYEGSVVLTPSGDAAPVTVSAGEVHTTGTAPAASETPAPARPRYSASDIARLEAELEEARAEQEVLALESAISRGQLKAVQGEFSEWPSDVPEVFTEDFLVETLGAHLDDIDDASLERVDCDEYPCMVVVRSMDESLAWGDNLQAQLAPLMAHYEAESTATSINHSAFTHEGGQRSQFMIVAVSESDSTTPAVKDRLDYRMDELIDELGELSREEAGEE